MNSNFPLIPSPLAYGFGTVMVVVLSLLSLLGVLIVPLAKKNERFGRIYEYVNLFLVALGTSALFSDAILHLIPGVRTAAVVAQFNHIICSMKILRIQVSLLK